MSFQRLQIYRMGPSKHVKIKNTRKSYEICSKLTIKTIESRSGAFIGNF